MPSVPNFATSKIGAESSNGIAETVDREVTNDPSEKLGDETADAVPLGPDESEEELGAFDDSHLQVDQPTKKKGKKKRRPKSKRGQVLGV
jgi:hypothetical protein